MTVNLHSYRPKQYCFYREPDYDMIVKANEIVDLNMQFIMTEPNRYWYDQRYRLGINDDLKYIQIFNCSCICYNKSYMCKHTIALVILQDLRLKDFQF